MISSPNSYDCVIVGGGVIGLSLARELAAHHLQIAVIDRQSVGQEASWAGAGILPPANRSSALHPIDELRAISYELHQQWAAELREETGIDNGYRVCGGLYLACSIGEAAALRGMMPVWRDEVVRVEALTADELASLESTLALAARQGHIRAACLLPDEAQLRNPRHLKALKASCQQRGVALLENHEALAFDLRDGAVASITTSRGPIRGTQYCVCSGPWTQRLLASLQIQTGILPIRGQMVLFATQGITINRIINVGPRYMVPRDDGRLLVGSTEEEVGFAKETTAEAMEDLTCFARKLIPSLETAPIEAQWAGLRPATFDGFPYLGRIPGLRNGFVAAGHFRSGLLLAPATAVIMSQLMRGEQTEVDLQPFSVLRS